MSDSLQFVIAALSAMFLNIILIPFLIKLAHKYKWYDDVNGRKIHSGKIPRIGGVGIAASFFVISIIFFGIISFIPGSGEMFSFSFITGYWAFFLGAVLVNIIGLLDDFTNLRPLYKLFSQIIIAIVIILTGHYFKNFYIPFFNITLTNLSLGKFITLVWIVGITNAVNLIDGMDGLSSGTMGIAAFFIGLTAFVTGNINQAIVVFILFGSLAGFLIYNFPPAKLFMGDSGSLFIGFVLAVLPLYSLTGSITPYTLILSISFLFIPTIDTLAAIIRRKIKKVPFHSPDKEHLHHKLLALGFSTKQVLFTAYVITLILSLFSFLFALTGNKNFITVLLFLWVIFTILLAFISRKVKELK